MFDIGLHQREYQSQFYTVIDNLLPANYVGDLFERARAIVERGEVSLVDHCGQGTTTELDAGGRYLHYIFLGEDIRKHFQELIGIYHAILPVVSSITLTNTIISPFRDSDINIKAYPPGGGTVGRHRDTNGISALLYMTTNSEGALEIEIERKHPSQAQPTYELRKVFAKAGSLVLMQGRKVWHQSAPTLSESKYVIVFNYYEQGDTWRPEHFDKFVYAGVNMHAKTPPTASVASSKAIASSTREDPIG